MNILHLLASRHWGGGEQYVFDLASRQMEAGHNLTLISGDSKIIREKVAPLGCRYYTLKNRWHFNPFSIAALRRIMAREQIAVAHAHQFRDAFIAVLAAQSLPAARRPKIVMTRHMISRGKNNFLYRYLYRHLDHLIFVSAIAQREFLLGATVAPDKITVIHNSVIPQRRPAATDYRAQFTGRGALLAGFIGTISPPKGVELLLDAAERLRGENVIFLLAGTGEDAYVNFLREQIRVRQLPVSLLGFLDNPHTFAAQMDVGVLPSLVREAFPLAALDFMSAGVPVVASNNGGQVESVENEKTGLLVAPAVDAVAAALTRLLADENLRRTLGENARQAFARQFAYPIFYDKIMAVYAD